jgi:hypothetical protein
VYGWIWRHLPGPVPLRIGIAALLVAAVVAVLFLWGFAYLAPYMPFNDGTVTR